MPTPRMPKSKCRYCIPSIILDGDDIYKGYACKIDAWDPDTTCRPRQCHYYRLPCKTRPASSVVTFPVKQGESMEGGQP